MYKIPNYEITEIINESQTSLIARGRKKNAEDTVIIKLLKSQNASEADIARFRQEYEIIRNIDSPGIIHTYELINHNNNQALILEDFNGVPLQQKIEVIHNNLSLFLNLAIDMAVTLGEIHKSDIVHKDVNPSNFIISHDHTTIKITDFGISSMLLKDDTIISGKVEGTLKYISPEQTGRMNRLVDYRTDYYSLGITFYEMLTGSVPFNYQDPMELIHAHIARIPEAPAVTGKNIPKALSDIVMKLIAKTGEDRYQSAYSIVKDLKNCRNQLLKTGEIKDFPIAQNDIPHVYIPPHVIVGRDTEIAKLTKCFESVCNGNCEIVLVEGHSGIGKSTLINELYKPISEARGFFISGKYNRYRKNVPYSALIQAFKSLANQVLSETPDRIDMWKNKLLLALGPIIQVLVDIVPEIEEIVGKQPSVPSLDSEQEQNRFKYAFKNFFKIMSSKETPLTFFLDDLQWVDLPSLDFIEMMIKDPEIESFLLICAYRDDKVDKGHPFIMFTEKFAKYNRPVERLSLSPLNVSDVNRLIVTALHCDKDKSLPLAEIVNTKTNGNPFFVNQYLSNLYDKKHIHFNPESGWEWSLADIKNLQITDNVVDLMSAKITELSDKTINILKLCSCIGNRFSLELLSLTAEKTIEDTLKCLMEAVNNGLIIFNNDRYRFVHDKVHEAAYLLTSDDEKKAIHLRTAQIVLKNASEKSYQKKILYIVDQYNKGIDLITEKDELETLAKMNLDAGKKAKNSIAYKTAAGYFNTGLSIIKSLNPDHWKFYYDLSINLYSEAAQTMMFLLDYEKMDEYANNVIKNGDNIFDKVHVYETLILNAIAQTDEKKALQIGLSVSGQMGIRFPKRFLKFRIAVSLLYSMIRLIGTKPEDFITLPETKNSKSEIRMRTMSNYADAAYVEKPAYIPLISLKTIMLIKKFGHTPTSPYTLVSFGLILCLIGKYQQGIAYAQVALKIIEKFNYPEQKAKVYMALSGLIMHWQENPRDLEKMLMDGYNSGLESGDHIFAAHCFTISTTHNFHTALNLDEYEKLLQKYIDIVTEMDHTSVLYSIQIYMQVCRNLKSNSDTFDILTGDSGVKGPSAPFLMEGNNRTILYFNYFSTSIISYLAGNYQRAETYINKALNHLESAFGLYVHTVVSFYSSLIWMALYPDAGWLKKQQIKLQVRLNLIKMKRYAKVTPVNHLNKYYLVKAEFANINHQNAKASEYYYKAIETAAKSDFTHEEGMAHELAANFYIRIDRKKTAIHHLKKAKNCFLKWGATAKVKQLAKKYPDLLEQKTTITKSIEKTETYDVTSSSKTLSLDFSSIMKSSQAFSSITDLKLLLEKVLIISMENAGAENGALLLENNGDLFIEAEGSIEGNTAVLQSIPLNTSTSVCIPIIKSVLLRKKSIVLNDASNEGEYVLEKYIVKNKLKSVLAVPVIHQNKLTGILYLENNLATRVFTPGRVNFLQVLTIQAAISIKIARQSNELSIANKELLSAKNIAENANKAKTDFLANMAHEFRTPLNGIEGELQLLKDIVAGHAIPESIEHIDHISVSSKRLMASINEVLDFSDLESGTLVPDISVFNIARRIENIPEIFKNEIQIKNLIFKMNIDSELPELINGDEKRIIRSILCLLENSIKFTTAGSITLGASYNDDSYLKIVVEDTGPGIPQDKLNQLFNAFGQSDNDQSFTKPFEGLGLGLSITAKIIQIMNGTINAESVEGKGAKFTLSIPAKKHDNLTTGNVDFSKLNALIVEDNKVNALILSSFLKKMDIQSETAVDGKIGVEKFSTGRFNIIFMDVQMPVMNGIEATIAIRKSEAGKSTPIICVTANAKKQDCMDAGMDAFIQKPVNKNVISETIVDVITQKNGH